MHYTFWGMVDLVEKQTGKIIQWQVVLGSLTQYKHYGSKYKDWDKDH